MVSHRAGWREIILLGESNEMSCIICGPAIESSTSKPSDHYPMLARSTELSACTDRERQVPIDATLEAACAADSRPCHSRSRRRDVSSVAERSR